MRAEKPSTSPSPQKEVPASVLPELNGGEEGAGGRGARRRGGRAGPHRPGGASGTGTALAVGGLILLLIALLLLFLLLKTAPQSVGRGGCLTGGTRPALIPAAGEIPGGGGYTPGKRKP